MSSNYNPKKLFREPGVPESLTFETNAEFSVTDSRVDSGVPLKADLQLVAADGGIDVTGTVNGSYIALCRRCLKEVRGTLFAEVDERFLEFLGPEDDEAFEMTDGHMNLAEMAIELAGLALPLSPLCSEDCAGPDPDKFPVALESEEEVEPQRDPRWAALDALRPKTDKDSGASESSDIGDD